MLAVFITILTSIANYIRFSEKAELFVAIEDAQAQTAQILVAKEEAQAQTALLRTILNELENGILIT